MEKKRSRSGLTSDDEEEYRRISLRKKRSVRYNEDRGGDSDVEEEDEDEEEEDEEEEDSEKLGPSTQNAHTQTTQGNRFLTVICGNKKGVLVKEQLERGEVCIKCGDSWYSPPAFEILGGKGSSKKWKQTILHKNEPLQSLFERGVLTTKGYKSRRAEPERQKKIPLSNPIISLDSSSEDSEIQTAEESDDEAVKDEDWLPSNGNLLLEAEKESVKAENGEEIVDSDFGASKEEDEMEDEDVPSGGASDSSVSEEREPKGFISTPKKSALQMDVKVVIRRLTEFQAMAACQSNHKEPPPEDSWCQPLDEDAQNEEDWQLNGSGIDETAAADSDPTKMSHPPEAEGAEGESGEEFAQYNERRADGHRDIKTQTRNSPSPLSAAATSSPDIDQESENTTNNRTAILSSSAADRGLLGDMKGVSSATKSQRVVGERKYQSRDATTSRQQAADLHVIHLKTRISRQTQASNIPKSSKTVEAPSYRPSTTCDLDTMDLDQLRREKLKMQIKVLRLQAEYYGLKIKGHKNVN